MTHSPSNPQKVITLQPLEHTKNNDQKNSYTAHRLQPPGSIQHHSTNEVRF